MASEHQPENFSNAHLEAALTVPVIQSASRNLHGCDKVSQRSSNIEDDFELINDLALMDPRVIEAIDNLRTAHDTAIVAIAGLSQILETYYLIREAAKADAAQRVREMHQELKELDK